MFDNAWVYNKKTSRVFKYCTKLSEVFDAHINAAMMKLGFCCGMRVSIHVHVRVCQRQPPPSPPPSIPFILKSCTAMASRCVPFLEMGFTTATRTGTHRTCTEVSHP